MTEGAKMAEERPCDVHTSKIDRLEKETEDQWTAINKLRDRLPVWATISISLLTFLLGCSLTYAVLAMKMAGK